MHDAPGGSRELVARALRGSPGARFPVGPLAVHFCARSAGVDLRRYTTDAHVLADAVARYHDEYLPDAVWVSADTWVTAEAMGASVGFPGDDQPMGGIGPARVETAGDIDRIPPADPSRQGRHPLMLEALERARRLVGEDVFVVACFDQYPFSLACALLGIERSMTALVDDPSFVEALMERCLEYGISYAKALATRGADLLSGGDSPAGLIGPERYRQLALPFEKRLVAEVRAQTGLPVSLHICGDTTAILHDMATSGADVLELDHSVPLDTASRTVGADIALWGNIDPVGTLSLGTESEVRECTRDLLRAVRSAGHGRFIASSGCTLAVETPPENLRAMIEEVRGFPAAR